MTDDEEAKALIRKGYKAALVTMLIYLTDPEVTKESLTKEVRGFLTSLDGEPFDDSQLKRLKTQLGMK